MNIELVKLTSEYQTQLSDMLTEWKADIEKNNTNHSPWAIFRNDFHDFDSYLENLEIKEGNKDGLVPDTTLFCQRQEYFCWGGQHPSLFKRISPAMWWTYRRWNPSK